jgi:hypothetical protein
LVFRRPHASTQAHFFFSTSPEIELLNERRVKDQLRVFPLLVLHDFLVAVGDGFDLRPIIEARPGVDVESEGGEIIRGSVLYW